MVESLSPSRRASRPHACAPVSRSCTLSQRVHPSQPRPLSCASSVASAFVSGQRVCCASLNQSPPAALQPLPPCVCISPLPASAGQPLPAQAPIPRPVLPESCGAGKSRAAGAAGGGKGRLIFLYLESLEDAISRKLQTALDALGLEPGARILDIGAGWGAFTEFGARRGYTIVSLTISRESEHFVRALIERQELSAEVKRCHLLEYEDAAGFDGIVNLGVTEHLPDYRRTMRAYTHLLKPGGRVFLDACSARLKCPFSAFTKRHIFPGNGTPLVLHQYLEAVAASPFEVLSVTDDRDSYRLTTRAWAQNLEAARSHLVARWGERQFRRFQLYLWGSVHGFETHQLGAYHLLLQKVNEQWTRALRQRGWARLPC
jgi:cyclopropane fatty-acyl-phospholipid synthase-like methyltransferase